MNATGRGYKACLICSNLGNEAVEGTVCVGSWTLRFESPRVTEEIPMGFVVAELADDGERIRLKDTRRPGFEIFTFDQSILEDRSFAAAKQLRAQVCAVATRREISRRLRLIAYFLIGCVLVTWMGSWAVGAMVRSLVGKVPLEWEEKFGEAQMELLRGDRALLADSNLVTRLETLVAPLMSVIPPVRTGYKFHVAANEAPNAFALPGGHVVVNTGLLRLVERPEELLGVLAHEMAHVREKHIARSLISSSGPLVIFGVFFRSREGLVNLLGAGSGVMIAQGFSQEYETEADEIGWKYLVAGRIDPRGMISMFRKFQAEEARQKVADLVPQAFSSHPALAKRIARLEVKWKRLPNKSGFQPLTNAIPLIEQSELLKQLPRSPRLRRPPSQNQFSSSLFVL